MNCNDCGYHIDKCRCSPAGGIKIPQVPGMENALCHACGVPGGYEFCTRINCPNPYVAADSRNG
jgi:hypothetical protein